MQGDLLQGCQEYSPSLPPWPLWRQLERSHLDAVALLAFAADGDNAGDAHKLAAHAAQLLSLCLQAGSAFTELTWQQPLSWNHVYGGGRVEGLV